MERCGYCGTPVDEDGNNPADGNQHSYAVCREYVTAAKNSYKRELSEARATIAAIAAHAKAIKVMSLNSQRDVVHDDLYEHAAAIIDLCGGKAGT